MEEAIPGISFRYNHTFRKLGSARFFYLDGSRENYDANYMGWGGEDSSSLASSRARDCWNFESVEYRAPQCDSGKSPLRVYVHAK